MNLVIDIGNSRIKFATFEGDLLTNELISDASEEYIVKEFMNDSSDNLSCLISSVREIPEWITQIRKRSKKPTFILDSSTLLPFHNSYETKQSLGKDRLAAVAGAVKLYPSKNVLIIDAGTAITYEVKTAEEEYLGGNISPGLSMRFKALNNYTSQLPLLSAENIEGTIGRNTRDAILLGVQEGLIYEINGYIDKLRNKFPDLIVVLTGGDAPFFENKLKKTIFVVSNLTLTGLNFILQHNAENQ